MLLATEPGEGVQPRRILPTSLLELRQRSTEDAVRVPSGGGQHFSCNVLVPRGFAEHAGTTDALFTSIEEDRT